MNVHDGAPDTQKEKNHEVCYRGKEYETCEAIPNRCQVEAISGHSFGNRIVSIYQ